MLKDRSLYLKLSFYFINLIICSILIIKDTAYAYSETLPQVKLSTKPLGLRVPPTEMELMAAGQMGGPLFPTNYIADGKRREIINTSFGLAIEQWNRHNYVVAIKLLLAHIEEYPESPWAAEAGLHVGCDAQYHGRYADAEEWFRWIIENNKDRTEEGAIRLFGKAMLRLGVLKFLQNDLDTSEEIFAQLKKESLDWRERTYSSQWIQRISSYRSLGVAKLKCGSEALAYLVEKEGDREKASDIINVIPADNKGQSISDIINIASRHGYALTALQLSSLELGKIPLPAIVQLSWKGSKNKGHYWILEKVLNKNLTLYDPQGKDRFTQTTGEFLKQWNGFVLVSSSKMQGNAIGREVTAEAMRSSFGGCCGIPRPEASLGEPEDAGPGGEDCPKGSPVWHINKSNMNFYVTDIPLWYNPPIGPPVNIRISYNSLSSITYNEPFGNKWMFNYASYLVVDTGGTVTIFMPDGRRDVYVPDGYGGYTRPFGVFNTLIKIVENRYLLEFQDGTTYLYDIPVGTTSQQPFLVEVGDGYGQKLTIGYNPNIQLTSITDALGRVTTLTYNDNGYVTRATDPFGRNASFEYDPDNNLTRVVDMGGYWTNMSYDNDVYLTSIENQKGTWNIYIEPSDGIFPGNEYYPPPGGTMWEYYRITITNPLENNEEYFYNAQGSIMNFTHYVSQRDYIYYQDKNVNNKTLAPKTKYFTDTSLPIAKLKQVSFPDNTFVQFTYTAGNPIGKPTQIYNPPTPFMKLTYNVNGLPTIVKDQFNQAYYTLEYYPNNVDVENIVDGRGVVRFVYNSAHDVISVTDRLNYITEYSYNTYGQITSMTEAKGTPLEKVTNFIYDPTKFNLVEVSTGGAVVATFAYDNIDRINAATYATGIIITYEYNGLDKITKITYPDDRYESYTYCTGCPNLITNVTDRAGFTTNYTYDPLKRLTQAQGPSGISTFMYDANGNLIALMDENFNVTNFYYNLNNKIVKKTYADGKYNIFTYNSDGLLSKFKNSRNMETLYYYNAYYRLWNIYYPDSTPDIGFVYDKYFRLTRRTDGTDTYVYAYDNNDRLISVDGPWTNDNVAYQYDELGRVKALVPQGGQTVYYSFDNVGRPYSVQTGTNVYSYTYLDNSNLVQNLLRPNGSVTDYSYSDPLKRLTDVQNKKLNQQLINGFSYAYNNQDLISGETVTNGNPITSFTAGLVTSIYDNVNRLMSTTNPNRIFAYDNDANMTIGYTPEGYALNMQYDAENRITTAEYTDSISKIHRTEYAYSGDGLLKRVKKYENGVLKKETRFVRAGFLPIQERDGTNAVKKEFTWGVDHGGGIGGLLNLRQSGSDYSYLYDGRGNVTALLDNSQNVVETYSYDPYGTLMNKTGSIDQPFMFSTKQYDTETGLQYFGYRFYNPAIGRWLTRDPIGEAGGLNLYSYTANDPLNWVDPDGLSTVGWVLKLTRYGTHVIGRLGSKAEAVLARKAGKEVKMSTKQAAKEVARAACGGKSVRRDAGHILGDKSRGMPHYHSEGVPGHTFWGGVLGFVGSLLDPFDVISGELSRPEDYDPGNQSE